MEDNHKTICKSVFKSDKNTASATQFTQKWIELINRLEKDRSVISAQTQKNDNMP